MRKVFAYLVTIVTLISVMVFFAPGFKDDTKFAMEYTGGFEVLYKTKSSMREVNDKKVADTISVGMKKILDINGYKNSIINVEDGNYIRVNMTSNVQMVSDEIRSLIQNNESYKISFRDFEDNLLATGDQILKEVGASYDGETTVYGQTIINLNIKDVDLLEEITTTISGLSDTHLVIWVGFEEGVDSYANINTDVTTGNKVIYNATVSEPLNEEVITITGSYTEDEAKNTVNLVNSGTYKYELELVQVKSVNMADAKKDRTMLYISLITAIALIIIAMVVLFKLQGAFAILPVVFSEFSIIYLFNKLAGVISYQVIGAFLLANVIMFALLFMVLNRYKNVLKTNKSPIKAYKEAFKKNGAIILDTTIASLIFSVITYFIGTNTKNFSILLGVSSLAIFVSLFIIERFVMYLTCDLFNKNDKPLIVASNESTQIKAQKINNLDNIDKYTKHTYIGFGGLIALAAIVVLIFGLTLKSPFTFYDDAKKESTLEIVTDTQYFTTTDQVKEFFNQEDMSIKLETVTLNHDDGKYHVTVTSKEGIAKYENYLKAQLVEIFGENTDYKENYIIYFNDYNPTSVLISFKSTLYTCGIALLLVALYFALRYKYSYALASIVSTVMVATSLVAFYGLTRLPVNSQSVLALTVIIAYTLLMLVPFFTKIKEYMNDTKKVYLSYAERVDCFKRGRNSIALTAVVATGLLDLISLIAMFFDLSNFSMYLAIIIGSLFVLVYNMIVVPQIWIFVENIRDKRKKKFKNKNISNSKFRRLDEQVFIGIND